MADKYGVTEQGFERPQYAQIRDDLLDRARTVFGPSWNLGKYSVIGLTLRAAAFTFSVLWAALARVYDSGYVRTAYGKSLDYKVDQVGITRKAASKAEGTVTFFGTAGDTVPKGTEVTNTDKSDSPVFVTREDAVIQPRGEVDAWVDAKSAGDEGNVGADTLNGLVSPVGAVNDVDNKERSDTLTLGNDLNTTQLQRVKIGEVAYQTVDVSDILHDVLVTEIALDVTTPAVDTSFYQLRVRIVDDNTGDVVVDPRDISTNVSPAGTETLLIDGIELDVRGPSVIRIEVKVESLSDADLQIQKDVTDAYSNGQLVVDGNVQSGDDWVASVTSETLGATRNGDDEETDQELRDRFFETQEKPGSSTLPSIESEVLNVDGVRDVNIGENTTSSTDAKGRPPKSFETTVRGGKDTDIANAILDEKPAGIEDHGGVTVQVTDDLGVQRDISFSRPVDVLIDIQVTITSTDEFSGAGIRKVEDAIIEYIGGVRHDDRRVTGLLLGENVIHSRVLSRVMSVEGVLDAGVTLRRGGNSFDPDNISIADSEVARVTTGSIDVSVQ